MNLLRLLPAYRQMEARLCAAEAELVRIQGFYAQEKTTVAVTEARYIAAQTHYAHEVTRYAEARAFDAQTIETMRASYREEIARLTELLDGERADRQWATDRLLESRDIRPIHQPSPREKAEAEAENSNVPRETLGPRQRATFTAFQRRAETLSRVEAEVEEYRNKLQSEKAAAERRAEEAKNGAGV